MFLHEINAPAILPDCGLEIAGGPPSPSDARPAQSSGSGQAQLSSALRDFPLSYQGADEPQVPGCRLAGDRTLKRQRAEIRSLAWTQHFYHQGPFELYRCL